MSDEKKPTTWAELGFTPEQAAEFRASAISPEIAKRAGLFPITDPKAAAKQFGRTAAEWADGRLPAWGIPYFIPTHRDPVVYRAKPAKPFEATTRDKGSEHVRLVKYMQPPKTGVHVCPGPRAREERTINDASIPLAITEGEKKALALETAGLPCIAVPGVSQWRLKGDDRPHPYFAHWKFEGRRVYIFFDADALTNKDVRREELALGRALEKLGATVRLVRMPQALPKIDDFLAAREHTEFLALLAEADREGQLPPDTRGPSSEEWAAVWNELRLDPKTERPVKDVDNLVEILTHHPAWVDVLAFDARRERQLFLKPPPFGDKDEVRATYPRPVGDTDATRVGVWLVREKQLGWALAPKPTAIEAAIGLVCQRRRFDGVARYLSRLAPWDKTPRLDRLGPDYFGTEDTEYARTVVAKWMLSAVARARTPGCQADHVLVLEGAQGIGKSTALRILASDEFFASSLPEIPSKDAHEYCVGPWIIELGELDHLRKSEVTALKAFVSERAPRFREAYGRRSFDHPRRCVFAGTTNDDAYLSDSTGNRRFWPVRCTRFDLEGLARDRDQLWAEAVARVRAGEEWHLTDEATRIDAERAQKDRRTLDPWHDVIANHVEGRERVTVTEILKTVAGIDIDRHDQRAANRVAHTLRELGWVRRQVRFGIKRVWVYEPASPARLEGTATGVRSGGGQVTDFPTKSLQTLVSPVVSNRVDIGKVVGNGIGGNGASIGAGDTGENSPVTRTEDFTLIRDLGLTGGVSGDAEQVTVTTGESENRPEAGTTTGLVAAGDAERSDSSEGADEWL